MKKSDVCRCCLSDVCFKDMSNEYDCGGHREIYGRMLTDTFSLRISYQPAFRQLICEGCIVKLRDAVAFKKQVLQAEDVILEKVKLLKSLELDQDELYDDFDADMGDDFSWKDDGHTASDDSEGQVFVIKLEPMEDITEAPTKKVPCKKVPNIATKSESATKYSISDKKNNVMKKVSKTLSATPKCTKTMPKKDKIRVPTSQYQLNLRDNTIKLISNSNMCLFESLKTKYGCCTCKEKFFTIQDLREHSKAHTKDKGVVWKIKRLRGLTYKNVDITNLACKLCEEPCNDLNELKNHLIKHGVTFSDSEHLLIPYKLDNDFKCVLCDEKFNTYMRLSIHMNRHFANNVCDICGLSYINRMSLRAHMDSLHKEKRCSLCPATFQTNNSRVKHMRKIHNLGISKRYCLKCGKTFRYSYLLFEHQVKEHGAKRQVVHCLECGKTFYSSQNLKIHMRSVHLRERNYPCSICEMRFFTKFDQRRHERTHEDVRSFSCTYCEAKFKSKDSCRRHCRRQHGLISGG